MNQDQPTILDSRGNLAMVEAAKNNWYEGSRWSPNRSFIWFPVQDANRDLDRYTRMELCKNARYLYKNSPFIRGMIERVVTLAVGCGFHPVPKCEDPKWRERIKAVWRKKAHNVSLGPKCSWSQYQRAAARARFLDGEGFSVLTFDDSVSYENRIQGLEADMVVGGSKKGSAELSEFAHINSGIDGINVNSNGTPLSYNIKGSESPIDRENIVHHFTPNRLGQQRGETILAAAINTARDIDDILALEKQCVKDASSKKDIIKTASGTLDAEAYRLMRFGTPGTNTNFNLPTDDNAKNDYYNVKIGAGTVVLRKGDEYTPYVPNRPGSAWQGFIDFLSSTTCFSSGLPPSVFLPIDIGGTDIRRDLDIAQRVVEPWQMDMVCELDELYEYLMEGEVYDGELKGAPPDWNVRKWHMPQKINVDRQQAQQDREDVGRGLMSREEYHARWGEDADEVDATIIAETSRRRDAIKTAKFESVEEFAKVLSLNPQLLAVQQKQQENQQHA
jgi:capsid protein